MNVPAMQRLIAELRQSGISDENVLAAIAAVDRERFVSAPFAERAWDNTALPISFGQTISQPLVVAAMTEALRVGPRMKVCDVGDGSKGWPAQAPFDRIIVTAAAEERPQALIDQLAVGGILIVPVGRDPTSQVVERIVKSENGLQRDTLMPVRFVPLVTGALPVLGQG